MNDYNKDIEYLIIKCKNESLSDEIINDLKRIIINANIKINDIDYKKYIKAGFRSIIEKDKTNINSLTNNNIKFIYNLVELLTRYHYSKGRLK